MHPRLRSSAPSLGPLSCSGSAGGCSSRCTGERDPVRGRAGPPAITRPGGGRGGPGRRGPAPARARHGAGPAGTPGVWRLERVGNAVSSDSRIRGAQIRRPVAPTERDITRSSTSRSTDADCPLYRCKHPNCRRGYATTDGVRSTHASTRPLAGEGQRRPASTGVPSRSAARLYCTQIADGPDEPSPAPPPTPSGSLGEALPTQPAAFGGARVLIPALRLRPCPSPLKPSPSRREVPPRLDEAPLAPHEPWRPSTAFFFRGTDAAHGGPRSCRSAPVPPPPAVAAPFLGCRRRTPPPAIAPQRAAWRTPPSSSKTCDRIEFSPPSHQRQAVLY